MNPDWDRLRELLKDLNSAQVEYDEAHARLSLHITRVAAAIAELLPKEQPRGLKSR